MSKKVKLYLLVVVNLLTWGYVAFKVYKALEGDEDLEFNPQNVVIKKIETKDNYVEETLKLNYADPFLKSWHSDKGAKHISGAVSNHIIGNQKEQTQINKATVKTPTVAVMSVEIKYLGLVKNNSSGAQTALLNVNGKSIFAKLNDVIDGYTISEIFPDVITVKKGKEKLSIKK